MKLPSRIIVRVPNYVGDLVMATSVFPLLRERFPFAHITAMVSRPLAPLLEQNPNIDELFPFDRTSKLRKAMETIQKIRKGGYDLSILLPNSLSSALYFWMGGAKQRIGYRSECRTLFLSKSLSKKGRFHRVVSYQRLLSLLGLVQFDRMPSLFLCEAERQAAREQLSNLGVTQEHSVVAVHASTLLGGPARCWIPERVREVVAALLKESSIRVIFLGNEAAVEENHRICEGLPLLNFTGKTSLRELVALIDLSDVVLSNDSGPMHMAAALSKPLVALFGPTDDQITGPYKVVGQVINKHVFCSPCRNKVCPTDFRCMKEISSEEVYREVYRLLFANKEIKEKKFPR